MSCSNKKSAFTLVELLVVIMIISVLTGVLLTVIDPVRQRQRARDGTIISTANKIVAAVTAYNSAVGVYPSCLLLANSGVNSEIKNAVVPAGGGCDAGSPTEGVFTINGIITPDLCDANGYTAGTTECMFKYISDGTQWVKQ